MLTFLVVACVSLQDSESNQEPADAYSGDDNPSSTAMPDRSGLMLDVSDGLSENLVHFQADDGTLSEWYATGAEALLALRDVVIEDQEVACPADDLDCLAWYDNLIDRIEYAVVLAEAPPPPGYSDDESDEVEDCELYVEVRDYPWSTSKGGGANANFDCGRSSDEDNYAAARVTIKRKSGSTRGTDKEDKYDDEEAEVEAAMKRTASDDKCDTAAYVLHTDSGLALYKHLTTCE